MQRSRSYAPITERKAPAEQYSITPQSSSPSPEPELGAQRSMAETGPREVPIIGKSLELIRMLGAFAKTCGAIAIQTQHPESDFGLLL
jgi:hypothetical protein